MKKLLSYALCAAAVCLASCSQDETLEQVPQSSDVISFRASLPADRMQSRADANVKRYVMQVCKGDGSWVDVNLTDESADAPVINGTGEFTIDGKAAGLEEGVTYTALFWADYDDPSTANADAVYSTSYLSWVTVNAGKTMTMAYQGKKDFVYGEAVADQSVVLTRAVAQVNLIQKTECTVADGDKIQVSYKPLKAFNVKDTKADDLAGEAVTTEISLTAGDVAANAGLGHFYTFASPESAQLTDFIFTYTGKDPIQVASVPLRANYQINITGDYCSTNTQTDYTFNVTTDDVWSGNEDVNAPDAESGEQGGEEQPSTDTTAPEVEVTVTSDGLTVNYSITATDETTLAGGWMEVKLSTAEWVQVENQYSWIDFGADAGTTQTVTGSFTVPAAGTYYLEYKVRDGVEDSSHEVYANQSVIVTE